MTIITNFNNKIKDIVIQFFCFAFIGIFGTAFHYIILILLVNLFYVNSILASIIGSIIGTFVNYILNYHWTFQSNKNHKETMTKFFTVASSGMLFNALIMAIAVNKLQVYYLISQLLATSIVLFWNFTANKIWTF